MFGDSVHLDNEYLGVSNQGNGSIIYAISVVRTAKDCEALATTVKPETSLGKNKKLMGKLKDNEIATYRNAFMGSNDMREVVVSEETTKGKLAEVAGSPSTRICRKSVWVIGRVCADGGIILEQIGVLLIRYRVIPQNLISRRGVSDGRKWARYGGNLTDGGL